MHRTRLTRPLAAVAIIYNDCICDEKSRNFYLGEKREKTKRRVEQFKQIRFSDGFKALRYMYVCIGACRTH